MDFMDVTAGKDDAGRRIDRIMRNYLSEQAMSSLYRAIRTGLIRVDGKKCSPEFKVREGSRITIAAVLLRPDHAPSVPPSQSVPAAVLPPVIFDNPDLIAINKPYDIPVQPSGTSAGASLAEVVTTGCALNSNRTSLSFHPGPLHRLDRKTTGILFFSRSLTGAQWFSEALRTHQISKYYIALIQGRLNNKVLWQDEISKNQNSSRTKTSFHTVCINDHAAAARVADTTALPLAYGTYKSIPVTLAQIEIGSGLTHQIRAQAAYHGYPLLGDTAYGGQKIHESQDLFLHAYEMHFPQPNPVALPEMVRAFISTNFEKMLTVTLIKWDGAIIL